MEYAASSSRWGKRSAANTRLSPHRPHAPDSERTPRLNGRLVGSRDRGLDNATADNQAAELVAGRVRRR